ncbi:hypothetical protein NWE61_03935 [Mycoplasmopsis felis]|uniref:hypothetical protein n=1 Tax=Mycoplasmopsis felis TaxID=33923 RepID=UPI0021DFB950|nr:hypothetical protein [Mycoplasmopsis felis]MCU9934279.1 hypothetical protein [Mycoplasmopsis felis]
MNKKSYQDLFDNSRYFTIISTRNWSQKILKFNKLRDVVDKTFSSLKTNIDFKKINAQSSIMFESKMFISFIDSIIRSRLYKN